jgi:hypothetical protein
MVSIYNKNKGKTIAKKRTKIRYDGRRWADGTVVLAKI